MPSPIAHALAGVAVAWLADAASARPVRPGSVAPATARMTLACATLAVLPDADLLLPVAHRTATHSLIAVVIVWLLMIIVAAVTGKVTARTAATCAAAYGSHLLLDWLQADPTPPYGLQVLWPFSPTWFISGWNVFRATERRRVLEAATMQRNLVTLVQELAIMVPAVMAAWLVRVKALSRLAAEMSRGHHPLQ